MGVKTIDPAGDQGFLQERRQRFRKLGEFARPGSLAADSPNGRIGIGHPLLEPLNRSGETALPREDPFLGRFGETET